MDIARNGFLLELPENAKLSIWLNMDGNEIKIWLDMFYFFIFYIALTDVPKMF